MLDPALLSEQILPVLSSADRTALTAMLGTPVPVDYFISGDTRLLVEPKTGAIVSLDRIDTVLTAAPDLSRLAGLGTMLSKPQYADSEAVQRALAALRAMPTGPTRAMRLSYAQTSASASDMAVYVQDLIDGMTMAKLWIPEPLRRHRARRVRHRLRPGPHEDRRVNPRRGHLRMRIGGLAGRRRAAPAVRSGYD